MILSSWHKRIVPTTMVLIGLLFTEKAIGLAREATAKDVVQPEAATSSALLPSRQPLPAVAASGSMAVPPVVSPEELRLLQDLRGRRKLLDERERGLDQRADLLRSAQTKLDEKLQELTALQKQLDQMETVRRIRESQSWSGLVKTYEDMKPRDAAAIFDVLDMHVLLEVLDRMDERKAAAVLAGMLPERARIATQMLAQKRTRQETISPVAAVADQHS